MSVKITGIELKTSYGKLKFTWEDARELYWQLHELFGRKDGGVPGYPDTTLYPLGDGTITIQSDSTPRQNVQNDAQGATAPQDG